MARRPLNQATIEGALELVSGAPELVVVDARVLRLLMGDLASLIILRRLGAPSRPIPAGGEPYVWDEDC